MDGGGGDEQTNAVLALHFSFGASALELCRFRRVNHVIGYSVYRVDVNVTTKKCPERES